MLKPRNWLSLLILTGLPACIFDSGELWRDDLYVVAWIDVGDNITLSYDLGKGGFIGRVDRRVIAVGSNKKYVVAKQNPTGRGTTINYYIIDRAKDHTYANTGDVVIGPLSEAEFEKKRVQLDLPKFSKEFR